MTVPGVVDASWFVTDDANHTPHRETLNTSTAEKWAGSRGKFRLSVSMNSPRLGNFNDRQINAYLRTLAILLSNLVAKLNSVMCHALARSKLPSVDSIQSSLLENGGPRLGCCVYYGSILGNVELYLNYPLNSCLPCERRIARQVGRAIRLGGGEHNGQGGTMKSNEMNRNMICILSVPGARFPQSSKRNRMSRRLSESPSDQIIFTRIRLTLTCICTRGFVACPRVVARPGIRRSSYRDPYSCIRKT